MYSLPKLHAATVHFPVALLTIASLIGLLYLFGPQQMAQRNALRTFFWWTTLGGWIGAAAAILSGLLAQSNLPPQPPYAAILNQHIGTGLALLLVYGALLYLRWQRRPSRARGPKPALRAQQNTLDADLLDQPDMRWWITLLIVVGFILVFASGWNGGRLVYDWGVNVLTAP